MSLHKETGTFIYDTKDFNFTVNLSKENGSVFDNVVQHMWNEAKDTKVFRYILNIRDSKVLKGKYRFLVQLNPDRAQLRRTPQSITSVLQPFNSTNFNFTKLTQQEILFDIGATGINDTVAFNASPMEQCHCLLITERLKCLPQIVTEYSVHKIIELCLLSNLWFFRAALNGLCAHASVNHLHWHFYYLKHEMLLEYIDVCSYIFNIYLLVDYPAKGFCLKLSDFKNIKDFVSRTFLVVNFLQLHQMPHNIFITRAKLKSGDELYNDIRVYIWARKPLPGTKSLTRFIPGVCELFGHLSISDENLYNNLTEDEVIKELHDITEEYFLSMKDKLKNYIEKRNIL